MSTRGQPWQTVIVEAPPPEELRAPAVTATVSHRYYHRGVGLFRASGAELGNLSDSCTSRIASVRSKLRLPASHREAVKVLVINLTMRSRPWHPGQTAASYVQVSSVVTCFANPRLTQAQPCLHCADESCDECNFSASLHHPPSALLSRCPSQMRVLRALLGDNIKGRGLAVGAACSKTACNLLDGIVSPKRAHAVDSDGSEHRSWNPEMPYCDDLKGGDSGGGNRRGKSPAAGKKKAGGGGKKKAGGGGGGGGSGGGPVDADGHTVTLKAALRDSAITVSNPEGTLHWAEWERAPGPVVCLLKILHTAKDVYNHTVWAQNVMLHPCGGGRPGLGTCGAAADPLLTYAARVMGRMDWLTMRDEMSGEWLQLAGVPRTAFAAPTIDTVALLPHTWSPEVRTRVLSSHACPRSSLAPSPQVEGFLSDIAEHREVKLPTSRDLTIMFVPTTNSGEGGFAKALSRTVRALHGHFPRLHLIFYSPRGIHVLGKEVRSTPRAPHSVPRTLPLTTLAFDHRCCTRVSAVHGQAGA